jgi:hypothetical protein
MKLWTPGQETQKRENYLPEMNQPPRAVSQLVYDSEAYLRDLGWRAMDTEGSQTSSSTSKESLLARGLGYELLTVTPESPDKTLTLIRQTASGLSSVSLGQDGQWELASHTDGQSAETNQVETVLGLQDTAAWHLLRAANVVVLAANRAQS